MSDLYSVIPGLQPTAQELLEGELLCKQILEAKFPDLDLREGTALRDLVIRPGAMLFALMNKAGQYYFTQNTLSNIDNVTPSEVLDSILSNWFLTRNVGIRSVINARLYFARSKNITVSSSVYFSTDNVIKFFPTDSFSYPAEALVLDSYSNEYYVDVDMVAENEGTTYNISSGSLLYFNNFDPYFLRAEINYLKSESISTETNLEFIARSKSAISTRNLINVPSIDSNLRSEFNFITRLITIGMGDPEMLRDTIRTILEDKLPVLVDDISKSSGRITIEAMNHGFSNNQRIRILECVPVEYEQEYTITVSDDNHFYITSFQDYGPILNTPKIQSINSPVLVHNGGAVDIFCSEKLATSTVQLTTDESGKLELSGPIFKFSRSEISAGDEDDSLPSTVVLTIADKILTSTGIDVITSTPHGLVDGDLVTVSKVYQNKSVTSISSIGLVATVICNNHGYLPGDSVIISNAVPDGYNGTYTIASIGSANSFNIVLTSYVNTSAYNEGIISLVNLFNGSKVVSATSANKFSINVGRLVVGLDLSKFDILKVTTGLKYSITNPNTTTKEVSTVRITNGVGYIKVLDHSVSVGRYITLSSATTPGVRGSWLVTEITDESNFQFKAPSNLSTSIATDAIVKYATPWNDVGFSQKQNLILDFGTDFPNRTASFDIEYFQNLDSIQNYLELPANRVLCADYLAKGFNFYKLQVEITSYNGTIPDPGIVSAVIKNYLDGLQLGETFIMSDMMSQLRLNGIINIQNPPKVTFEKYNRDLPPIETGTITDMMNPNDRTSVFLLDSVQTFAQTISSTNNTAIIL